MGATTATRVGDGADCLFFGGNAGGGLKQIENSHQTNSPNKTLHRYKAEHSSSFIIKILHTYFSHFQLPPHSPSAKTNLSDLPETATRKTLSVPVVRNWTSFRLAKAKRQAVRSSRSVVRAGAGAGPRLPEGPSDQGRTSKASKKQGTGLQFLP